MWAGGLVYVSVGVGGLVLRRGSLSLCSVGGCWAVWWDDAVRAGQWQSVVKAVASCMHTTRHLSHLCPHISWPGTLGSCLPLHCSSSLQQ